MDDLPPPDPSAPPAPGTATPSPGAPTLTPVETDTGRIVAVGTAVFAVAAVVLLVLRLTAPDWSDDHPSWVWTALAGALLGLVGLVIIGRHRRLGRTR